MRSTYGYYFALAFGLGLGFLIDGTIAAPLNDDAETTGCPLVTPTPTELCLPDPACVKGKACNKMCYLSTVTPEPTRPSECYTTVITPSPTETCLRPPECDGNQPCIALCYLSTVLPPPYTTVIAGKPNDHTTDLSTAAFTAEPTYSATTGSTA